MSKRVSIILLSVTVLLAVWVFVSMLVINPQGDEVEERLAGQVALRLAEDEEFIEGVSGKVEEAIPGYITAWVESDAFKAILNDMKARIVAETVAGMLDGPVLDVIADAAVLRLGADDSPVSDAALDRLSALVVDKIENDYLEGQVLSVLEANREALVDSFLNGMIAAYMELPTEDKAAHIEAPVLALYEKYGEALASEIITRHDITEEVLAMYEEYGEALAADIISKHVITEEVNALIEEAKDEPVDIEAEVLALYEKYGRALASEIIQAHEDLIDYDALVAEVSDVVLDALEKQGSAEGDVVAVVQSYNVSSPVFGEAFLEEAGTVEYNEYRNAYKSEALGNILAIIGE